MKNQIKKYILPVFIVFSMFCKGQVGVNTDDPKTTLDIAADGATASTADGLIAPKLTRQQLTNKTAYGSEQTGAIVYVTNVSGSTNAATAGVLAPGYHVFDGTKWTAFGDRTISANPNISTNFSTTKIQQAGAYNPANTKRSGAFEFRVIGDGDNMVYQMRISPDYNMTGNISVNYHFMVAIGSPDANNNGARLATKNFTTANRNDWQELSRISTAGAGHFGVATVEGTDMNSFYEFFVQRLGGNSGNQLKSFIINRYDNVPVNTFTSATPLYSGNSVINTQGVGYYDLPLPAASTIQVQVNVVKLGAYNLTGSVTINTESNLSGLGFPITPQTLTYSASGTFTALGDQWVTFTPNTVTPKWYGSRDISISGTGVSGAKTISPRIDIKTLPASSTDVMQVSYGLQTWMDRNLGAHRAALTENDPLSYGNYYQWGRGSDGHEIIVRNGDNTTSGRGFHDATASEDLATSDTPGHPNFILTSVGPYDWISDNNNNRWQTANQGPCPATYHVPTDAEWNTADNWNNSTDTYNSALKLPSAGYRDRGNGLLSLQGTTGYYWSSTVSGTNARHLNFNSTAASTYTNSRAHGFSVRCLKD